MRATVVALIFALSLVFGGGCTKAERLEATAKSLNAVAQATNVAWAFAIAQALEEEQDYADSVTPATTSLAEAQAQLEEIRARWDARFAGFRAIKEAHETAIAVFHQVEAGKASFDELVDALSHVLKLYRQLAKMLDLPQPEDLLPLVE